MTDYNWALIIGGALCIAAVYIPEIFFRTPANRIFILFIGFTIAWYGFQLLIQEYISLFPSQPAMDFSKRWFCTILIISSYLFISILAALKLLQLNRSISRASS